MTDKYNWNLPVLLGDEAKDRCTWVLENMKDELYNKGLDTSIGMWYEKDIWVAYDNSEGDCWVEEFTDIREAYLWVTGQKEIGQ